MHLKNQQEKPRSWNLKTLSAWSCAISIEFAVTYIEKMDFELFQMDADSFEIRLSDEIENIIMSDVKDYYLKKNY